MNVRTQLVLAFLLLAVLPLAGIVLFSYMTSERAFRQAVFAEITVVAEEMSDRLDGVRRDIDQRLDALARLPMRSLMATGEASEASQIYTDLMARAGDVAELVDWFEFTPVITADEAEGEAAGPFLIYPSMTLTKALERLQTTRGGLEGSGISQEYLDAIVQQALKSRELLEAAELEALEARGREMERLLGTQFTSPVRRGGETVGYLKAQVPASQILRQVLARTPRDQGEIPFARDAQGDLFVESPEDRTLLDEVTELKTGEDGRQYLEGKGDWIVVRTEDPEFGMVFGVARPVDAPLREIRRTAVENFAYGLALVVLAMAVVLWLSGRMTRKLTALTAGAERRAAGYR